MKDDRYLVTGCGDGELKVWKLSQKDPYSENKIDHLSIKLELANLDEEDDVNVSFVFSLFT